MLDVVYSVEVSPMFSAKRGSAGMYRALTELRRANFARVALSLVHNTSHSNAARCGVRQAPRRAFNYASVFTILIKSARPHPLYPCV